LEPLHDLARPCGPDTITCVRGVHCVLLVRITSHSRYVSTYSNEPLTRQKIFFYERIKDTRGSSERWRTQVRRRLGPEVFQLLRRGGATQYLVAVRGRRGPPRDPPPLYLRQGSPSPHRSLPRASRCQRFVPFTIAHLRPCRVQEVSRYPWGKDAKPSKKTTSSERSRPAEALHERAMSMYRELARQKGDDGWRLTLLSCAAWRDWSQ
jgi:hypothetical protein